MKRLIDYPSLDDALAFGWRAVPALIFEHWWIYVVLAVASAALTGWNATPTAFRNDTGWFFIFPALAGAVRLLKHDYRMRVRTVLWLIALYVLGIAAFFCAMAPIIVAAATFHHFEALFALFIVIPAIIWVAGKTALSPVFYALGEEDGCTVFEAIAKSWTFVSGAMWWVLFGLEILVGLICLFVPGLVMGFVFFALANTNAFLAAFVAAIVYLAGLLPMTVWLQASYVALISTGNSAEPIDASPSEGAAPA